MSPCGYGHGGSPCLHVDTGTECIMSHMEVSMWMWIVTWRPACGYGHGVYLVTWRSPCDS